MKRKKKNPSQANGTDFMKLLLVTAVGIGALNYFLKAIYKHNSDVMLVAGVRG